jgi:hypothetical protein
VRVVVGVLVAGMLLAACDSHGSGPIVPTPGVARAASAVVGSAATVELVSGATAVSVVSADLGASRVRVSTPADAGQRPALTVAGSVVSVQLLQTATPGPSAVTIELDRRVRWDVRLSGGATSETLDLGDARLSAVSFLAGATTIDLRLPAPSGAVPIRLAGGATSFAVHVPAGVATGVRVGGGAGSATVHGVTRAGIPGGTVLRTAAEPDRYDIDAVAGVSTLTVD